MRMRAFRHVVCLLIFIQCLMLSSRTFADGDYKRFTPQEVQKGLYKVAVLSGVASDPRQEYSLLVKLRTLDEISHSVKGMSSATKAQLIKTLNEADFGEFLGNPARVSDELNRRLGPILGVAALSQNKYATIARDTVSGAADGISKLQAQFQANTVPGTAATKQELSQLWDQLTDRGQEEFKAFQGTGISSSLLRDTLEGLGKEASGGVSSSDNWEQVGAKRPDLAGLALFTAFRDGTINDMIRREASGAITIEMQKFKNEFSNWVNDVEATQQGILGTLDDIQKNQNDILAWIKNQKSEAERAKARQEQQQMLSNAQSAFHLLATFIGFKDKKLGRQVDAIGTAVIAVTSAVLAATATGATIGSTVGPIGTAVGAVIGLIIAFASSNDEPSPEQMILDNISKLQQQVSQLRREMHERFDRIDQTFTDLFKLLDERFSSLDFKVSRTLYTVLPDMQKALFSLYANLNRYQRDIYSYFIDSVNYHLADTFNYAIGHLSTYRYPLTQTEFSQAENVFYTWGGFAINTDAGISSDSIHAGTVAPDYGDANILTQLTNLSLTPLDGVQLDYTPNINYLAQFPNAGYNSSQPAEKVIGLPPLVAGRLANPRYWSLSVEAYLQLLNENLGNANNTNGPGFAWALNPARLAQMRQNGAAMQTAFTKISLADTADGTHSRLFNGILARHKAAAEAVEDAVEQVDMNYHQDKGFIANNNQILNIFWGADQSCSWPLITTVIPYAGANLGVDVAFKTAFHIPSPFVIADFLASKSLPGFSDKVEFVVLDCYDTDSYMARNDGYRPDPYGDAGPADSQGGRWSSHVWVNASAFLRIGIRYQGHYFARFSAKLPARWAHFERWHYKTNPTTDPNAEIAWIQNLDYAPEAPPVENRSAEGWVKSQWDTSVRRDFLAGREEDYPDDATRIERNQFQLQVGERVETFLRDKQVEFYNKVIDGYSKGTEQSLVEAVNLLSGYKALLQGYIAMGLSRTLRGDASTLRVRTENESEERYEDERSRVMANGEFLRAVLVGDQRLLEKGALTDLYNSAIVQLQAGYRVPRVNVPETESYRVSVLEPLLSEILDDIHSGLYEESLPIVAETLAKIDLYNATRNLPNVADKTSSVQMSLGGIRYDRGLNAFLQDVVLRNSGSTDLPGPVSLVLDKLAGATSAVPVRNKDGDTLSFSPQGRQDADSPYINLNIGSDNLFKRGEIVRARLILSLSKQLRFTPRILAGSGDR